MGQVQRAGKGEERRDSSLILLPLPRGIDQMAERARANHALARTHAQHAVIYAAKCGAELLAAKRLLPHGRFGDWVHEHVGVSDRTAQKYMALARAIQARLSKPNHGSHLASLELPDPRDPEANDGELMRALRKILEGRTLRQMYLGFGILKPDDRAGAAEGTDDERARRLAAAVSKRLDDMPVWARGLNDEGGDRLRRALWTAWESLEPSNVKLETLNSEPRRNA